MRGSALRQAAREMIAKSNAQNQPVEAVESSEVPISGLVSTPKLGLVGTPIRRNNYDNMSFNNAFRAASNIADNGGDKTFT